MILTTVDWVWYWWRINAWPEVSAMATALVVPLLAQGAFGLSADDPRSVAGGPGWQAVVPEAAAEGRLASGLVQWAIGCVVVYLVRATKTPADAVSAPAESLSR